MKDISWKLKDGSTFMISGDSIKSIEKAKDSTIYHLEGHDIIRKDNVLFECSTYQKPEFGSLKK